MLEIIYSYIKYFKLVFFNKKKIRERSGTIWNDLERYGTIWNDMELERSRTFVNVRRTFRQGSYERPVLYMCTFYNDFYKFNSNDNIYKKE